MWLKNKNWLNGKSYITPEELFGEYQYIIDKLCLVLFTDDYWEDTKIFCRSVLDFAVDHEYITWKQANAVLNIRTTEERRRYYNSNPKSGKYVYKHSEMTDREHDKMCKAIFGDDTRAEELEGYTKCYRDDGSRYFALPTGDERLEDYI